MKISEVSIIITTRNEEENIADCLESIKSQAYPQDKIEIIVVDNNSTDNTKEIAGRYTDKVYNHGSERSAQRNFGIRQARGEYLLYLDADMALTKNVIVECVDKSEKENFIALYIPERIIGKGFWGKVRDFERSFYDATCIDCVRFVHKNKFLEISGFDESLTGVEDWDFDRKIRKSGKVSIVGASLYHNENHFNFKKYLKKKNYYSKYFHKYIQKWGKDDPIIKKQFGVWYRFFGIFIENKKWKKLVAHPILTFGMYLLKIMVGFQYLIWYQRKNPKRMLTPEIRWLNES